MMKQTLERLQRAQNISEAANKQHRHLVLSTINSKFPWLVQTNTLPNFFVHKADSLQYRQGKVVFMQHHRSAGTALQSCLEDYGRETMQAWPAPMSSDNRADWDAGSLLEAPLRERLKFHHGMYSFGLCDDHQGDCSHFTILRHPLERAKSSYEHCKQAYGDEMCQGANANSMTLRDWTIHQGSLLFNQLLFQSDVCLNYTSTMTSPVKTPPCWLIHKSHTAMLPGEEQAHLLDYIIENMDKWFAFIGLYEDLDNSLQMLEHVYKIPFSSCQHLQKSNSVSTNNNRANVQRQTNNKDTDEYYDDYSYDIQYDYMVQKTLAPDIKIYEKAKDLYKLQKQKFFNKLK